MSENYQKCFDELSKLSDEKRELDKKHEKAGWALRHEVEPMPASEFWTTLELLRIGLMRRRKEWGWDLETAILGMLNPADSDNPALTLYRFINRWKLIGNSLRDPLGEMELEYRGDDSWGDLIGGSPLFGETIYKQLLTGAYKTEGELKEAFKTYCIMVQDGKDLDKVQKNAEHMVRSVLNGENYFVMRMDKKALELFTIYAIWNE